MRGNKIARGFLSIGRQAQMIPVLHSTVVHMVELRTPKVWSVALEPVSSVVMRSIDVMQTLKQYQPGLKSHHRTITYKNPRQNTIVRPNFSRDGRFKLLMTGKGRRKIQMSPRMFAAALAYQNAVRLMQVPGIFLFQMRGIGVHSKMVAMMLAIAYRRT
jgi:hypothetical protein